MRILIQRVSQARVVVSDSTVGTIRMGLLVFLGVAKSDAAAVLDVVRQAGGALLIVSQFTLYADCRKGRRPSFDQAAPPEAALSLYNYFVDSAKKGPVPVETGVFQASMEVHLVNDGPVTIQIDSPGGNPR